MRFPWITLMTLALAASPALAQTEGESDEEAPAEEAPAEGDAAPVEEAPAEGDEPPAEDAPAEDAPAEDAPPEEAPAAEEAPAEEAPAEEAPAAEEPAAEEAPPAAVEAPAAVEQAPVAEEAEDEADNAVVSLVGEAGALWLTGNTASITANGRVAFGVKRAKNKFGLQIGGAYGRAKVEDVWADTATRIFGDVRYDRFLTDRNSLYVLGVASHDPFAGSLAKIGANLGYSRLLVSTDQHSLTAEGGINYTHDEFTGDPLPDPSSQNFVGARLFASYALNLNGTFGISQSVESLLGGTDNEAARFDGSLTAITGLSATITKILSLKIGFALNYDFVPPEGFKPIDTTTSLTLVATLL